MKIAALGISIIFRCGCVRGETMDWANHWTINVVSIAYPGPFITLNPVILGILEGHTAPLLPASKNRTEAWISHLQSLHLLPLHGTTKSSITQHTVKPTLTVIPYDSFYLTPAYPFDALQLFSAATIVSRINAFDGTLRYFSVFLNYTLSVFLYWIPTLQAGGLQCISERWCSTNRAGEERAWVWVYYELFMCVCPKAPKKKKIKK